jgi:flagellar hook assembly protein FlgD
VEIGDGNNLPTSFGLSQNYPNPFNPETNIDFALPKASNVELTIFNVLGQKVVTLINEKMDAGTYRETWRGTSESGTQVASGIYFYRLTAGDYVTTKKMMMLK